MKIRLVILAIALWKCACLFAAQYVITPPSGSGSFGTSVNLLPNGNFVVCDPGFDDGATSNVGAVRLYDPNGTLISTLKGSSASDSVGSRGIVVLTNGNFVVVSPAWKNGSATLAGAITWVNGTTGLNATVSVANSLVGSTTQDTIGTWFGSVMINALPNGNYFVLSPQWDNGAIVDAGAGTLGNGTTGTSGAISASNSLVGSKVSDFSGSNVTVLPNSAVVLTNYLWDNGAAANAGAATWINGYSGLTGTISSSNSLVGTSAADVVGAGGVAVLNNGHYVVGSPGWSGNKGAVTWCNTNTGTSGTVSAANSLTGSNTGDRVGYDGIIELSNGNYVVQSSYWKNDIHTAAGAATWCNGLTGLTGPVTTANSLVGTGANDRLGQTAVALPNGHYVVAQPSWASSSGAVIWCSGVTGRTGTITAFNSLIGGHAGDSVGSGYIHPLTNGNYVVVSFAWGNGTLTNLGAVTWCAGNKETAATVSAANSLIGSHALDQVGSNGVLVLTNGNYVVLSPNWDNGSLVNAGAVTWCNGATGFKGMIHAANSLVGTSTGDAVGAAGAALTNGNYVVGSSTWHLGSLDSAGAATWGNGTTGVTGPVSTANSLTGSKAFDRVGERILELADGNYLVSSQSWSSSAALECGAVTYGNGSKGITGVVSETNSLLGASANELLGYSIRTFRNGAWCVISTQFDNGAAADAGAVTFVTQGAVTGTIGAGNAMHGTAANGGSWITVDYDPARDHTLIGLPDDNAVRYVADVGTVSFTAPVFYVLENDGPAMIQLTRTGGYGQLNMQVTTSSAGGTATAGVDYTPLTGQVVTFAPGVTTITVPVAITADAKAESNETFKVSLGGVPAYLGSRTSAIVHIIEVPDAKAPPAPVVTTPAASAQIAVNAGGTLTATGTASDDRGVKLVNVSLNGAAPVAATLVVNGSKATWSCTFTPVAGLNSLGVQSIDTLNNASPVTTRNFIVTRPLVVKSLGGTGTITSGYSPTSFRATGRPCTITATPAAGFIFANWTLSGGATTTEIGLTDAALELPTITFSHREGVQLTANFVPSPYTAGTIAGQYNGLVQANLFLPDRAPAGYGSEDGTGSSNSTDGYLSVTVQPSGAFTGNLKIDGLALPLSGSLDHTGEARFGASRSRSLSLARPGKTSLALAMKMNIAALASTLGGTVLDVDAEGIAAHSDFTCDFAYYNGTTRLPVNYLGTANANGSFTATFGHLPVTSQGPGLTEADYPQGDGIANVTVTRTGAVTITTTLADGTTASGSGTLSGTDQWQLFLSLYGGRGHLRSTVVFDSSNPARDFTGIFPLWTRPILDSQHYPNGWSSVMTTFVGARLAPIPGQSILTGLTFTGLTAPAQLTISDGFLGGSVFRQVLISKTDAVTKAVPGDTSFTVTALNRSNGQFSGSFTDLDGTRPAFRGIVLQKDSPAQGAGFFLTTTPKVKDYRGQSGSVRLEPN